MKTGSRKGDTRRPPGHRLLLGLVVLASLLIVPRAGRAQELGSSELEAAFLLNFLRFTAWPEESFSVPDQPVVVTLIGADDIARDLSLLCAGEPLGAEGRSVLVQYRNGVDPRSRGRGRAGRSATSYDLRKSHMIFIGRAEARHTGWILDQVAGQPVLTVSDDTGFVIEGGMLALVIRGGRMTFDADPDQIDRAGLTLSSKVLRLAHVVKPGVE